MGVYRSRDRGNRDEKKSRLAAGTYLPPGPASPELGSRIKVSVSNELRRSRGTGSPETTQREAKIHHIFTHGALI